MHWKIKAALFRTIERVPFGAHVHYLAQRHVTKTWPRREATVKALVAGARMHLDDYVRACPRPLQESVFFEIGSGRDLVVPLAMRLLGAGKIITTDISRLAKLDLVNAAAKTVALALYKPVPFFHTWQDLQDFGITYMAPFDAGVEQLPPVDVFISNEVLEHVPPEALRSIFENVTRALPEGGASIHAVDYSDHYARDGGVSRYNFLQYSDDQWRPFNAGPHYVNRLRHSDYIAIMERYGLQIREVETHEGDYPRGHTVAPKFAGYLEDDLRIIRSRIIAIKTNGANSARQEHYA